MNNAHFLDIVNDSGHAFVAQFDPDRGTVAFFEPDNNPGYPDLPYPGYFTGVKYYVDTLLAHRGVLHLHGGVEEWVLSEYNVFDLQHWLYTF